MIKSVSWTKTQAIEVIFDDARDPLDRKVIGTEVDVKLEIRIRAPDGIDDRPIRIVFANALKHASSNVERD